MADPGVATDLGRSILSPLVSEDPEFRKEYASFTGQMPEGVVRIRDASMLGDVIRWARGHRVPLVPASSGPPHDRATLGVPKGGWLLDFSGMKRVVHLNRRNRVALFEAGVCFEELIPPARKNGLRVMLPLMPRRGKSTLAAYLDREPTIYPQYQWDISDPLLCLEAVYGTGDLFRTGSAAGPGSLEDQWLSGEYQKSPMGPGQSDWAKIIQGAQGGIGLATWCSAKCEVRPKAERLLFAGAPKLNTLVEASYRLFYRKLTDIHFLLDRNGLASLLGRNEKERERVAQESSDWNLICSVSGIEHFPEERVSYLARESERELKGQGAEVRSPPALPADELLHMLLNPNVPTRAEEGRYRRGTTPRPTEDNWRDRPLGGHRAVYFQTTMDKAQGFVERMNALTEEACIGQDRMSCYLQPQLGGRCCHLEFILSMDPHNSTETERTHAFSQGVAEPLIQAGAFFSRPHGDWAGPAMRRASSSFHVFEKTKDIFDPDRILVPGRLGLEE